MPHLPAMDGFPLDEEDLLVLGHAQDLVRGDTADEVGDILRRAVVPGPEYLHHARIIDERIGLRAVDAELRGVLPERPERKSP